LVLNGAGSEHISRTPEDVLNARDMDTSAQFALEQKSVQTVALMNTVIPEKIHVNKRPPVPIVVRNIQPIVRDAQCGSKRRK